MSARICGACGEYALHRVHRSFGQWMLSWIIPIRPLQCDHCDARIWRPLRARDGVLPWLSSLAIWSGVALFVAARAGLLPA